MIVPLFFCAPPRMRSIHAGGWSSKMPIMPAAITKKMSRDAPEHGRVLERGLEVDGLAEEAGRGAGRAVGRA